MAKGCVEEVKKAGFNEEVQRFGAHMRATPAKGMTGKEVSMRILERYGWKGP